VANGELIRCVTFFIYRSHDEWDGPYRVAHGEAISWTPHGGYDIMLPDRKVAERIDPYYTFATLEQAVKKLREHEAMDADMRREQRERERKQEEEERAERERKLLVRAERAAGRWWRRAWKAIREEVTGRPEAVLEKGKPDGA